MMKIRNVLLLLCASISLGTASGAKPSTPSTLHYKVRLKSQSFGDMGSRELWTKGSMMRWDVQSARLPLRILKNERGVFLIHSWDKVAGQYPEDSPRGNPRALLPGPTGSPSTFLKQVKAVKQKKQEMAENKRCNVYSYTEPVTKRASKLWVDAKSGKPVRLLLKGKYKVLDQITVTYAKFEEGVSIADSFFEVPKGYVIRPMPKMDYTSKKAMAKPNSDKPGA